MLTLSHVQNREAIEDTQVKEAKKQGELALLRNRAIADVRILYPNWSLDQCRHYVMRQVPELFDIKTPDATGAREIHNRESEQAVMPSAFKLAVEEFCVQNRVKFLDGWAILKRRRPDLYAASYGTESTASQGRPILNRASASDADQAAKIRDGIDALQKADRSLTYDAARQKLRRENPAVFGLDAA